MIRESTSMEDFVLVEKIYRNGKEILLETSNVPMSQNSLIENMKSNKPFTFSVLLFTLLWYIFSGCTLFLNKHILTYMSGNSIVLAASEMWVTAFCAFVQLKIQYLLNKHFRCKMFRATKQITSFSLDFMKNMFILGNLRFLTVLLGVAALEFVEVSFTETIKSTAPAITVVISRILLGEVTGLFVKASLVPMILGLILCSLNELHFNILGFFFAVGTNLSECLQNVHSKFLISGKQHGLTPLVLQFYSSAASLVLQLPLVLFAKFKYDDATSSLEWHSIYFAYMLNGFFYHLQTLSAYALMNLITPVSHSVANTAKRALLIWLSVLLFGNPVTPLSIIGTVSVFFGVLFYTKARSMDETRSNSFVRNL